MIRNDDVYSMKDIAAMWPKIDLSKEEGKIKNSPNLEERIRKKFVYVLKKKLGLSEEEIGWFKERKANGKEQFIFQAGERTPLALKEILDICSKRNVLITPSDRHSLIEDFAKILPYPISESEDQDYINMFNTRANRIEQAVHDLYTKSQEKEIFYEKELFVGIDVDLKLDKEKRQEFYKNQYVWMKSWKEKWTFIIKTAGEIRRAERRECLYKYKKDGIIRITPMVEEKFYKTGKLENETVQRAYKKMKKISSKDLCQYVLLLFIIECPVREEIGKETLESLKDKEGCIDLCKSLFRDMITFCSEDTFGNSMEDIEYMINEAVKELENDKIILKCGGEASERIKKSLYPAVEILREKVKPSKIKEGIDENTKNEMEKYLQYLSNLRRHLNEVENKKILVSEIYRGLQKRNKNQG